MVRLAGPKLPLSCPPDTAIEKSSCWMVTTIGHRNIVDLECTNTKNSLRIDKPIQMAY